MYPIIYKIGPLNIYSWGFMVAVAFLVGLITALRYAKKEGIRAEIILDLFIYVTIISIIGARFFYVIQFFSQFKDNLISIFYVWQGGLVFLGGLLFALAVILAYVKYHKLDIWKLLDVLSPATAIGYAIGRIGCFLNGCCYGIALFGIQQPTQIYSSISGLIIFLVLAYVYNKKRYSGQIFLFALLLYSVYRFLIEFLRYSPYHILVFTPSQAMVAIVFVFSLYALWKKSTT